MADKIGVYICRGCYIGEVVDVASLVECLSGEYGGLCSVVRNHPMLCSRQGIAMIKKDIQIDGLDGVLVAACSSRVKWDVFRFNGVFIERVNIREGCAWSVGKTCHGVEGHASNVARDYVKMGVVKLKHMKKPRLELQEISETILVVGGGFAGLTAALNVAAAGYNTVLVEKQGELGGSVRNFYKTTPIAQPYTTAQPMDIGQKIAAARASNKITIYTSTIVAKLLGAPGFYDCVLKTVEGERTIRIGAAVIATGWVEQDKRFLAPMGYGSIKNVVTSMEFERMAKAGAIVRLSDSKHASKVAFLVNTAKAESQDMHKISSQFAIGPTLVCDKRDEEFQSDVYQWKTCVQMRQRRLHM